jgi:hypothetical protein
MHSLCSYDVINSFSNYRFARYQRKVGFKSNFLGSSGHRVEPNFLSPATHGLQPQSGDVSRTMPLSGMELIIDPAWLLPYIIGASRTHPCAALASV